ncbi:MAG: hypothetical protein P4L69_10845, partial [Desulfosporosinus sp.]|nr:hypothetical protein [Desulfosporosinus sp.]
MISSDVFVHPMHFSRVKGFIDSQRRSRASGVKFSPAQRGFVDFQRRFRASGAFLTSKGFCRFPAMFSCAQRETRNGVLGFWGFGVLGFWGYNDTPPHRVIVVICRC